MTSSSTVDQYSMPLTVLIAWTFGAPAVSHATERTRFDPSEGLSLSSDLAEMRSPERLKGAPSRHRVILHFLRRLVVVLPPA